MAAKLKLKPLPDLEEDRIHAIKSLQDIVDKVEEENRTLTEEEVKETVELRELVSGLDALIEKCKEKEAVKAQAAELSASIKDGRFRTPSGAEAPSSRAIVEQPTTGPSDDAERYALPATARRYSSLKAFKGEGGEDRAYASGMWLQAAIYGSEKARRWCINHGVESRALSEGVNTAGGVLVPEQLAQAIIDLRETYGIFRQNCTVRAMASDKMDVPRRAGGVTATFTAEGAAATASDPSFNVVQLSASKLAVYTKISTELVEDAIIDMADWVAQEFAWAFAKKEDECGFSGDGTDAYGQITGVLTKIIDGNHAASAKDATSGHDAITDITADDLGFAIGALPSYAEAGAKWYCSRVFKALVFDALMSAGGGNTMTDLAGKPIPSYLGYPIVVVPGTIFPTSTANAAINDVAACLFGDLSQAATMGTRREIRFRVLPELYAINDQIAVMATERFDINVHDLGDGTTAGPIIGLLGVT